MTPSALAREMNDKLRDRLPKTMTVLLAMTANPRTPVISWLDELWPAVQEDEAMLAPALQETPDHPQQKDLAPNAPEEPSIEAAHSVSPQHLELIAKDLANAIDVLMKYAYDEGHYERPNRLELLLAVQLQHTYKAGLAAAQRKTAR